MLKRWRSDQVAGEARRAAKSGEDLNHAEHTDYSRFLRNRE
jgi:hypothetical protein